MRPSRRQIDELRAVSLERGVVKYAEGSCFVKFGDTHVLVTASLEERLPPWLKGQGRGWVTAEYGMLPRATSERTRREASAGKQGGRTVEIQRLIGRSLRSVVDLSRVAVPLRFNDSSGARFVRSSICRRWASARSQSIAMLFRLMVARARHRSPAPGSRLRTVSTG